MSEDKLWSVMRTAAILTNPKEIGIKNLSEKDISVFGVVMDIGYEEGTATLISYITGDASLYYSFGGGFVNGASKAEIKNAAIKFVTEAQEYLQKAEPVKEVSVPKLNEIFFYLLSNKGLFLLKANIEKINELSELFKTANTVISAINVYSEVKLKHKYFGFTKKA
ncbi:MAG: hypothetical protein FWF00_00855 [Endomicrobia bacterium]|nr:hypothetical protein [Endomicrobiia bacterium]MCL2506223.1 hypothetical protein [Endomicrobiia bacterium]